MGNLTVHCLCYLLLFIATAVTGAEKDNPTEDRLFGSDRIIPIQINVAPSGLDKLRKDPRTYVSAALNVDGRAFEKAEVHLKGQGSFQPITRKPSFTLRLDRKSAGKPFFGRNRLLLNNSTQDRSYIRWKLASELLAKAGLATARLNFAHVKLNDRDLGLYLLLEPTDKTFLEQHFGAVTGNLYEGDNHDVEDKLELDSGDSSDGQRDLQALAAACRETELSLRWKRLQAKLDVDKFATFMAMEVLICHHDGYSMDRNNFRIYHDPRTDRMVFIPHGMDLIFDRPKLPLEGDWSGTVARAFTETEQGKRLYRKRVTELTKLVYGADQLNNRITELVNFLRPHFAQNSAERKQFDSAIDELRQIIKRRRDFVFAQATLIP